MTFYQNAIIYKLKKNDDFDDNNIYIGSTSDFKNRKYQHKTACNNEKWKHYKCPVYQFIRDNGGWDEWVMIAIEQYSCNNKKELETRERYHIDLLRPILNKNIPTRTYKEYRVDNKVKVAKKMKEWCEANKEKIAEYHKERYENNKEIINQKHKEYYKNNKEYSKEHSKKYYENNKEIINQKHKEYYENNKEYFKERYEKNKEIINQKHKEYNKANKEIINQKVICDHCGCEITKKYLNKHQKTKKCLNNKKI